MRIKKVIAVASVALPLTLIAPNAYAEGGFSSYASNWRIGNSSRAWADRNSDGSSTTIYAGGCTFSAASDDSAGLRLRKKTLVGASDLGTKDLYCELRGAVANWGDVAAGDYYFDLYSISRNHSSRSTWSATSVQVNY